MSPQQQPAGHKPVRSVPVQIARRALVAAAFLLAFAVVVMLLWNALLPGLFSFHTVNYWQALGLLVLARVLFGGGLGYSRRTITRVGTRGDMAGFVDWWCEAGKKSFEEFSAEQQRES